MLVLKECDLCQAEKSSTAVAAPKQGQNLVSFWGQTFGGNCQGKTGEKICQMFFYSNHFLLFLPHHSIISSNHFYQSFYPHIGVKTLHIHINS